MGCAVVQAQDKIVRIELFLQFFDEIADAVQGFFDPFVFDRVAAADVPFAAGPETAARDHRDFALRQQTVREGGAVKAGLFDQREGVESPLRLKGIKAERIQPVDDQAAPTVVFLTHHLDIRFAFAHGDDLISWAIVGADMIRY